MSKIKQPDDLEGIEYEISKIGKPDVACNIWSFIRALYADFKTQAIEIMELKMEINELKRSMFVE